MRIRINLTYPTAEVPVNNQHYLNGFIFASFGENCERHNAFSDYNITSLQGGKLNKDKKTLSFIDSNPYFYISGNDEFIGFAVAAFANSTASFFGMRFNNLDVTEDFNVNEYFDNVVTVSPIIVKNKDGKKITFKDTSWLSCLMDNCKKKLSHIGIDDTTFKIEVINPHKAKEKCIWVGDIFNVCSNVRLKIYGSKKARIALYNMGLGGSTGSGFGGIKIYQ
jgi:CRISPR-associated endoribonuclease Cas6